MSLQRMVKGCRRWRGKAPAAPVLARSGCGARWRCRRCCCGKSPQSVRRAPLPSPGAGGGLWAGFLLRAGAACDRGGWRGAFAGESAGARCGARCMVGAAWGGGAAGAGCGCGARSGRCRSVDPCRGWRAFPPATTSLKEAGGPLPRFPGEDLSQAMRLATSSSCSATFPQPSTNPIASCCAFASAVQWRAVAV